MPKLTPSLILVVCLFVLAACGTQASSTPTPAPTAASPATKTLVIADISENPVKRIAAFQPLADYLAAKLSAFGIGAGSVKVAPDLDTMIKWMKANEVDIYFDSPYPTFIMTQQTGAKPILRRWKDGISEYHSVIFTRIDSGIASLTDLKGHMVAFEDPYSTSGYFVPKVLLVEAGLKIAEKSSSEVVPSNDEVGYVFSAGEDNIVQWVISGKAAAGAVNSVTFDSLPAEKRSAFKILAKSEPFARHVMMVNSTMDPELVEAIKTVLLGLDKTPEGKAVLEQFQETAKFDEFPDGAEVALSRIKQMAVLLEEKR